MITPPDENFQSTPKSIPLAGKKRMGCFGVTPQSLDKLKQPFKISLSDDKENIPTPSQRVAQRLYGGTPQSANQLAKPFKCPGSATITRTSEKPTRKRRKVDYGGADGDKDDGDKAWTNEDRLALANRDANKFPVFQVKDKDTMFRKRFAVPLIKKDSGTYNPSRPPPTLGLRQGAQFLAKPLHDPSGEFAIVLYDPTIDEKPRSIEEAKKGNDPPKLDAPLVHKSLADILGIKKVVEGERPKVPVVIDPRLAKVLRPHQIEGVKFMYRCVTGMIEENANGCSEYYQISLTPLFKTDDISVVALKSPESSKS